MFPRFPKTVTQRKEDDVSLRFSLKEEVLLTVSIDAQMETLTFIKMSKMSTFFGVLAISNELRPEFYIRI